ncbi:unnamed protein product, partial [Hydatigera taeniaeformis]|uniref:Fibronectin type-III domain-containing protein n=1 Tax=Hydatigena taeniaeformis TaxID=6205 RepID=A0A0R3WYN2_HYDTA
MDIYGDRKDVASISKDALSLLENGFATELPKHFHWIRVGSRSVELGWDVGPLSYLKADEMKLTANYYSESVTYVYKSVPFSDGKLTLDGLKPSTFYEMVLEVLKHDK